MTSHTFRSTIQIISKSKWYRIDILIFWTMFFLIIRNCETAHGVGFWHITGLRHVVPRSNWARSLGSWTTRFHSICLHSLHISESNLNMSSSSVEDDGLLASNSIQPVDLFATSPHSFSDYRIMLPSYGHSPLSTSPHALLYSV